MARKKKQETGKKQKKLKLSYLKSDKNIKVSDVFTIFLVFEKKTGKYKIALQLKLVHSSLCLFEQAFAEGKLSSIFKHTLSKNIQYTTAVTANEPN